MTQVDIQNVKKLLIMQLFLWKIMKQDFEFILFNSDYYFIKQPTIIKLQMIKNLTILRFYLSKIKQRRQHKIDPNLKDLTKAQVFKQQSDLNRQIFQSQQQQKTFSQTLKQSKPILKQRFKVDKQDLQKKLRKTINKQLNLQRMHPVEQDDKIDFLQSKSHIYDQRKQIQFQQKFRNELFKKKQTNRMVQKQKNDFRNYLPQPKNKQYVEYEQNKIKFKNSKIQSMMNFRRNNEQLRLLIDSGYIDNPENVRLIHKKLNQTTTLRIQHSKQQEHTNQNTENRQLTNNNSQFTQNQANNHFNKIQHESTASNNQIVDSQSNKSISPEVQNLHNQMVKNLSGPQQLRNANLLQQFFQKFNQSTEVQKQKAKQDLELIKKIKSYQTKLFQSRYDAINFRFKGQVNFTWMKQSQLLSYIKTERNQNTEPEALLSIFQQNRNKLNKFNQPIITPKVMSRIYAVCSLFKFPQSDTNNKINMLNDKKYIELQKNLFRNVHQLNDQFFVDAVFAYAKNHKQEQGLLKIKMNQKICQVIFQQVNERIYSMDQEDLGLVLRSIMETTIIKKQQLNWTNVIQALNQRIPALSKDYEFQSCMSFLTLLPATQTSIQIVSENIQKFKRYTWQYKQTLQSFLQCSSFLIRFQGTILPHRKNKMIQQLKHIVFSKHQEIMPITQKISINNMPQLLSIFYCLDSYRPVQANYQLQIPNKLINKCKKEIVDNIRQQKQLIKNHTIGNITFSIALNDYCKALIPKNSQANELPVLKISTLKSLFSFRTLTFNSINYFTYHELTKLVSNQIANIPIKTIVQTIFADSLVRYKNQGLIQELMGKLTEKIYYEIKQSGISQEKIHSKYMKEYVMLICSFHHNRTITDYYYFFMQKIIQNSSSLLVKFQPNLLIRLFQSVVSLNFTTDPQYDQDYFITKHFSEVFHLCYQNSIKNCLQLLSKEQLLVLQYVASMFSFFRQKTASSSKQKNLLKSIVPEISSVIDKINKQSTLSPEQTYLRQISRLMQKAFEYVDKTDQNQNQLSQLINSPDFQTTESRFYKYSIPQIMDQQQHIGTKFKYQVIYQNIMKKLANQKKQFRFDRKNWRIQNQAQKEVYFLATYEHLLAKHEEKNTVVKMFGIWKVYSQLYALRGWKLKLVCSFLEG